MIVSLGGLGFWLLDEQVNSFSEGLWLAFTTAATVGYGDMVPSSLASRVFAVLLVIMGLAVLSLTTAAIAALFIDRDERESTLALEKDIMAELTQLRQEIQALKESLESGKNTP